ncbi:hypothetical protein TanjilG_22909 [Lupinus angustifolius]|uniref:Pectinesterase n=1 Tax=Lupinus angustifolius TaxID=3871 RepID=A0A1J7HE40_LUPAN|nr:hypothetical protein TanjilG_22909 [Lupinus angustifolius]
MKLSAFEVLHLGFPILLLVYIIQVHGVNGHAKNFITWDDLMVDEHNLASDIGGQVIVVDHGGNGDSTTVQGAVDMVPEDNTERVKIYIYPGTYSTKASDKGSDGQEIGTVSTATVWVESDFFCATALTIQNLVDRDADKRQAVALRVDGDKAVFYKVKLIGEQDTLLDNNGTHYFYRSYIQGSVDFIFGQAKSLFHECIIYSVAEFWGAIAAHHRNSVDEDTGFSFVGCTIKGNGSVLLGRAWGDYATTIYSNCYMDNIISPMGWSDWNVPSRQRTAMFGEYQCSGKGSNRTERVEWSKALSSEEAKPFLGRDYIYGDTWLKLQ